MNWLVDNPWLVCSKEWEGGLCQSLCFDPVEKNGNQEIFLKRTFRAYSKSEKIKKHAKPQYHNQMILLAQNFVKPYEDPTTHIKHNVNKQKGFDRNGHILKLVIKAVNLSSKKSFPLHNQCDNPGDLFSRDDDFLAVVETLADMDPILKDRLEMLKWHCGR